MITAPAGEIGKKMQKSVSILVSLSAQSKASSAVIHESNPNENESRSARCVQVQLGFSLMTSTKVIDSPICIILCKCMAQ